MNKGTFLTTRIYLKYFLYSYKRCGMFLGMYQKIYSLAKWGTVTLDFW